MKLGTLTTGAVMTPFDLQYVPQYIFYVAATQLTSIVATVAGDGVIKNLNAAAAINFDSNVFIKGRVTNGYVVALANGLIKNKTLRLEFTNSAAQTPDVFAFSLNDGSMYVQSIGIQAQAATGVTIENFAYAGFPSAAAADIFNVTFSDGTIQQMTREELQALLGFHQAIANAAADYVLNNLLQNIKSINFLPVAAQSIYYSRFVPASGLVTA